MSDDLRELESERDALAAYAEDGKMLVRELFVDVVTNDATHLTEWAEIESPSTCLDRLKAQWLKSIKQQSRRVRNYSAPNDTFEAVPISAIETELRRQAESLKKEIHYLEGNK